MMYIGSDILTLLQLMVFSISYKCKCEIFLHNIINIKNYIPKFKCRNFILNLKNNTS